MTDKQIFTLQDAAKVAGPAGFMTLLKPAGSACNLDCTYCYYQDKAVQYGGREALMGLPLLEEYIRQYIEANEVDTVTFCWHGGEPTLVGLDYYRKAVEFQRKYAGGKQIENTIQTNRTMIDEAWCRFFAENRFLVGLSLDGPRDIHDAFRRTKGRGPTFDRVMQTVRLFRRHGVEYNTLSVVNRKCEGRGDGARGHHTFIIFTGSRPAALSDGTRSYLPRANGASILSASGLPVRSTAAFQESAPPSFLPRESSMHMRPSEQNAVERWPPSAFVTVWDGSPRRMPSSQFFQWSLDVRSFTSGLTIGSRSLFLEAMSGFILPLEGTSGSLGVTFAAPRMQ